jgi:MHS family proline/betaine transporter-like MFS transporter
MSEDGPTEADAPAGTLRRSRQQAVLAGGIGVLIENFDLVLYGYFATAIAGQFFPDSSKTVGLLSTLAVYGVGFVIRPVAGLLWGHISDRAGRRTALAWSVVVATAFTTAVGVLPGYPAAGVAAPALLVVCRLGQAFGASGEYAGANAFIIEYAPSRQRGRYAATVPLSVGLGLAVGAVLALITSESMSTAAVMSWGWRVPFLVALPIGLAGLYLRLRIEDSPEFEAVRRAGEVPAVPLADSFRVAWRSMLVLFGWAMGNAVAFYLFSTFFTSYLTATSGLSSPVASGVYLVALAAFCAVTIPLGRLVELAGRRALALASMLGIAAWAVPCFLLLRHGGPAGAMIGLAVYAVFLAGVVLSTSLAIVELFPANVRVSGSSLAYNLAYTAFGGPAPFIAAAVAAAISPMAPAYYAALVAVLAAVVGGIGLGSRSWPARAGRPGGPTRAGASSGRSARG